MKRTPAPAPPLSGIHIAVPITILLFIYWILSLIIDAASKTPR